MNNIMNNIYLYILGFVSLYQYCYQCSNKHISPTVLMKLLNVSKKTHIRASVCFASKKWNKRELQLKLSVPSKKQKVTTRSTSNSLSTNPRWKKGTFSSSRIRPWIAETRNSLLSNDETRQSDADFTLGANWLRGENVTRPWK